MLVVYILTCSLTQNSSSISYLLSRKRIAGTPAEVIQQQEIQTFQNCGIMKDNVSMLGSDGHCMIKAGAEIKTILHNLLHKICYIISPL